MDNSVGVWKKEFIANRNVGTFTFSTTNMQKYSPGVYEFTITGILGTKNPIKATANFFLELINPCPKAQLSLVDYPLVDIDYYVGDEQFNRMFDLQKII